MWVCSRGRHNTLILNVRILRTTRESRKLSSRQTDNPFYASRRQTLIVNNYCRGRYRRFTRKREFIIVTCIGRTTKVGALLATRRSTETNKILPSLLAVVFSNNIRTVFMAVYMFESFTNTSPPIVLSLYFISNKKKIIYIHKKNTV